MTKKRILCFGDSNTWGYIPNQPTLSRYDEKARWPMLLQQRLSDTHTVIEFGLCGCESGAKIKSMCFNADAQTLFPSILFASLPVDIVFIMLGTNDLKRANRWQSGDTAKNLDALVSVTHTLAPKAQIILASAVILQKGVESDAEFDGAAIENSKLCAKEIAELAERRGLAFFDTNLFVHELGSDGCHFTPAAHKCFADALAEFLSDL